MSHQSQRLLDEFTKKVWLIESIFWDQKMVLNNSPKEKLKDLLFYTFELHDVFDYFKPEFDEDKTEKFLKILSAYHDQVILPTTNADLLLDKK